MSSHSNKPRGNGGVTIVTKSEGNYLKVELSIWKFKLQLVKDQRYGIELVVSLFNRLLDHGTLNKRTTTY